MSGMKRSQDARDVLEIARVQELAPAAEAGPCSLRVVVEMVTLSRIHAPGCKGLPHLSMLP